MVRKEKDSNFYFIEDKTLRENLDIVFDHIVELFSLSESQNYDEVLKSSFRKTTIIHTAAIVEGLLLYTLKKHKTAKECASSKHEFKIKKQLYETGNDEHIVVGTYEVVREKFKFNKVNLDQVNKLCHEFELISDDLCKNVDALRDLRNRQHIGGLKDIDYDYKKIDLKLAFDTARDVKELVEHNQ